MILIDPWKDIKLEEPFDLPENIFVVKNSNIFLPGSQDLSKQKGFLSMYLSDKIKNVHFISQKYHNEKF